MFFEFHPSGQAYIQTENPMSFLVISRTHGLLPFAHRLRLEGNDVEALVSVPSFEQAWAGKLNKILRNSKGEIDSENLAPVIAQAEAGELTVLTDDWSLQALFRNSKNLFGVVQSDNLPTGEIRVGAWWDGSQYVNLHVMKYDMGLFPGGGGAWTPGGGTLLPVENQDVHAQLVNMMNRHPASAKIGDFKGLVQFGVSLEGASGIELSGWEAGWPFLHTHMFVAEQRFMDLLAGKVQDLPGATVAVPVTQPPWPNKKAKLRRDRESIDGMSHYHQGRVFWHDVVIDEEKRTISTAGLDGLVGVAIGYGKYVDTARLRALSVAASIRISERQLRTDAGAGTNLLLAQMEQLYEFTL